MPLNPASRHVLPTAAASRARRAALAATSAVAALLLLTACGSSSEAGPSETSGADGFAAYTQCLAENGVTLPSGGPGGPGGEGGAPPSGMPSGAPGQPGDGSAPLPEGVDAGAFAAAQEACADLRPSGAPEGMGAGGAGIDSSALAAYTSCLADNDVTIAGPADLRTLDTSDATVAAALETCAPLRPTPTASPSPTTT